MLGELPHNLLVRIVAVAQLAACELAQLLVMPRAGHHLDHHARAAEHAREFRVVDRREHVEHAVHGAVTHR